MLQKIYALLIGINEYPGTNLLNGCVNDANAMGNYLKEYYTEQNGFETQIKILLNSDATREGIIKAFRDLFGNIKDGDVCLFYYSGHGDQFKTPEEIYSQDEYCQTFVCYIKGKRADIADKELGALIHEITKGKDVHFVAITDCCHSGSITRGYAINRLFDNQGSERAFNHISTQEYIGIKFADKIDGKYKFPQAPHLHIASCRDSQKSIEKKIGLDFRGVFTYSMLDILTQKGGYINYESLTEQVKFVIKKHTSSQEPVLNKDAREILLGQKQFLNNLKIITGHEPVIFYSDSTWKLNKGTLHGVVKGDKIRLKENGLKNSYDAKVKVADMDCAVIEINYKGIETPENRKKNNLPVSIEFTNKEIIELVVNDSARDFKEALLQSPQLQKLEFVSITQGEPDNYFVGYDENEKQLFLSNAAFETPVIFSNKDVGSAATIDLFLDNIDKYSRARYFTFFTAKSNPALTDKYQVKFFLMQEDESFKEIELTDKPIKVRIKNAQTNAAKFKMQLINNSESVLFIRTAYTDACYGIQTDLHHELELQPGEAKYLEVKEATANRDITELFFDRQLLDNNIVSMQEQLKLFIADATFGINGFAQQGILLTECRPNGSKGNAFRAGRYNWVVENFNFEIEAI